MERMSWSRSERLSSTQNKPKRLDTRLIARSSLRRRMSMIENGTGILRKACIEAYGGKCQCCGETTPEFLAIDHISGGGGEERKAHGGGSNLLRRLRDQGFPSGYKVLCHNCNTSLGTNGYCPHQQEGRFKSVDH